MDDKLFKKMNEDGVIVITSTLNSESANSIIMTLLNFASTPNKEIQLFVSSSTHDYTNTMAIYDVIKSLPNPISTYCIGSVSGCAVLLLTLGNKGKRYILKNSEITLGELYEIVGTGSNQQTEVELLSKDVSYKEQVFESIIVESTNLSADETKELCSKSTTFNSNEAVAHGFVDKVLE